MVINRENGATGPRTRSVERREEASASGDKSERQQMSPSDYLRESLRPLEAGEQRIQGLFLKLECDNKGVAYFSIQATDRIYKVRATALERVQLTAYVSAPAEVSCGVRKNPENVVFTY